MRIRTQKQLGAAAMASCLSQLVFVVIAGLALHAAFLVILPEHPLWLEAALMVAYFALRTSGAAADEFQRDKAEYEAWRERQP